MSEALAYLAYRGGARFIGECGVQQVLTDTSSSYGVSHANRETRVEGVLTDKGTIRCQHFVNCAGIWGRMLGKLSQPQVRVPIFPAEHFFLTYQVGKNWRNVAENILLLVCTVGTRYKISKSCMRFEISDDLCVIERM